MRGCSRPRPRRRHESREGLVENLAASIYKQGEKANKEAARLPRRRRPLSCASTQMRSGQRRFAQAPSTTRALRADPPAGLEDGGPGAGRGSVARQP